MQAQLDSVSVPRARNPIRRVVQPLRGTRGRGKNKNRKYSAVTSHIMTPLRTRMGIIEAYYPPRVSLGRISTKYFKTTVMQHYRQPLSMAR